MRVWRYEGERARLAELKLAPETPPRNRRQGEQREGKDRDPERHQERPAPSLPRAEFGLVVVAGLGAPSQDLFSRVFAPTTPIFFLPVDPKIN